MRANPAGVIGACSAINTVRSGRRKGSKLSARAQEELRTRMMLDHSPNKLEPTGDYLTAAMPR